MIYTVTFNPAIDYLVYVPELITFEIMQDYTRKILFWLSL